MQTYDDIPSTDELVDSRQKILDRTDSLQSSFAGTGYPTAASGTTLKVGQKCYRTDSSKLFVLTNLTGPVWTELFDLSGASAKVPLASALATARAIALSGDVTGTVNFDGSAGVTISSTLANSGVTAATYCKVTVDAKGRVTAGTTLSASDLPATIDGNARVGVRVDDSGSTYTRRRINFRQGSGVAITLADDSGGEEVDVTLDVIAGTGISVAGDTVAIDTAVVPRLNTATAYSAVQKYTPGSLSIASNAVAWAVNTTPNAELSLTANVSSGMSAPTGISDGAFYSLRVQQDATGGRTISSWNGAFDWIGGTPPTVSLAANAVNIFNFRGRSTTTLEETGRAQDIR